MSKDTFESFAEALEYYQHDSDIRYSMVVERNDETRCAVLRTGEYDPSVDAWVSIWPAKDWRGNPEPVKVWGEEY